MADVLRAASAVDPGAAEMQGLLDAQRAAFLAEGRSRVVRFRTPDDGLFFARPSC